MNEKGGLMMRNLGRFESFNRKIPLSGTFASTDKPKGMNRIVKPNFSTLALILVELFKSMFTPGSLWYLFVSVLDLSLNNSLCTIVPFLIYFFLNSYLSLYKFIIECSYFSKQNQKNCLIWRDSKFVPKPLQDIHPGDIILLQENDQVPADLILIASGNLNKSCYIDNVNVTGEAYLQRRECVKEIQNLIHSLDVNEAGFYLNAIDGLVCYSEPDLNFKGFKAKLIVKGSPKSVLLSYHNMLLRGSVMKISSWVFGLVLFVGPETKIAILSKDRWNKTSKFDKKIGKVILCLILIALLFTLFHFLLALNLGPESLNIQQFLELILLYHYLVPFPILFFNVLGRVLFCVRLYKSEGIKILSPSVIEGLAEVEFLIVDKNDNLTDNDLKIHSCIIGPHAYSIEKISNPQGLINLDLVDSLKKPFESDHSHTQFFLGLALCNSGFPQEPNSFITLSNEDLCLIKLANDNSVKLTYKDSKKIIINLNSALKEFKVLFFKEPSSYSKRTRILVHFIEEKKYFLYVRGPAESMDELIDDSENLKISEIKSQVPGIQIHVLAMRELSKKEYNEVIFDYKNALICPVNKEGRVEGVIEQCESGLKYLGVVAIEDQVKEETKEAIKALTSNGIVIWVTSGNSENSTIEAALASDIIERTSEIVKLDTCDTLEELIAGLEDVLKTNVFFGSDLKAENFPITEHDKIDEEKYTELHTQGNRRSSGLRRASFHPLISQISNLRQGTFEVFKDFNIENPDFVLVLSGKCIEIGISSSESLKLLTLALFTAKSVICFNMMPNHKTMLVGILKNNFSFEPNIMAVGTECDLGMMNEAHIGVSKQLGDIIIKDFSDIKNLIFSAGLAVHCISAQLIEICVYFTTSLAFLIILFYYFSGFIDSWILNKEQIIMLGLVQQVSLLIPQYLGSNFIQKSSENTPPYIIKKSYLFSIFCWIGFGILGSGISVTLIYLTFYNSISDTGKPEDSLQLSAFVYMHFNFILFGIGIIEFYLKSCVNLFAIFLTGTIHVIFVLVSNYAYPAESRLGYTTLFNTPLSLISLFVSSLIVIGFYLLIKCKNLIRNKNVKIDLNCSAEGFGDLQKPSRLIDYKHNLGKVFKNSEYNKIALIDEELKIMPLSLKFNMKPKEDSFVTENNTMNQKTHFIYMQIYSISNIIIFIYSSFNFIEIFWVKILFWSCAALLLIVSLVQFTPVYKNNITGFIQVFFILSNLLTFLSICFLYQSFSTLFSGFMVLQLLIVSSNWKYYILLTITQLILDIYYKSLVFHSNSHQIAQYILTLLSIALITTSISYILEYNRRKEYIIISDVSSKIAKSNNVLSLLLPHFVTTRVKSGARYISIDQGKVSVLFCNICDFEEIFNDLTPYELTSFLDDLFRKFDQLCEIVGATKIETVGKTYMASAGLKDSESELDPNISKVPHGRRLIELGFGMINIIRKAKVRHNKVHVKIGINSGEVRAGVVGNHKPQFSLIGDTVNIASRMASTLTEYDTIQITQSTYEMVKDSQGLTFIQNECQVKGKGLMSNFIVKQSNNVESFGADASPGSDFRGSLAFSSLSGFISTHSTVPGISTSEISVADKQKTKKYAEIEYRESLMFMSKSSDFIEKIRIFSFSFKESPKEKKFRIRTLEDSFFIFFFGLVVAVFYYFSQIIIEIVYVVESGRNSHINLWFCIIQTLILSVVLRYITRFYQTLWFACILNFLYFYPIFFLIAQDSTTSSSPILTSLKVSLHALFLTQASILLYNHIFLISLTYLLTWLIYTAINPSTTSIFSLFFILLCQITVYHKEIRIRVFTNLKTTAAKDSKSIQDLLTHMVPIHAYQNLMDGDSVIDKLSQVTIIYADIVGFTAWCSDKNPEEVVNMLSEIFTNFDNLCLVHNVYKVHTIGDCYVAMSYVSNKNRDPGQECLNIINFAIAIKEFIEETNRQYNMGISMRIGIHTGDIIGGITGRSIVRYDIYGTDSFIANQMESNGLSGKIAISHISKNLISRFRPSLFSFTEHKEILVLNSVVQIFLLNLASQYF